MTQAEIEGVLVVAEELWPGKITPEQYAIWRDELARYPYAKVKQVLRDLHKSEDHGKWPPTIATVTSRLRWLMGDTRTRRAAPDRDPYVHTILEMNPKIDRNQSDIEVLCRFHRALWARHVRDHDQATATRRKGLLRQQFIKACMGAGYLPSRVLNDLADVVTGDDPFLYGRVMDWLKSGGAEDECIKPPPNTRSP